MPKGHDEKIREDGDVLAYQADNIFLSMYLPNILLKRMSHALLFLSTRAEPPDTNTVTSLVLAPSGVGEAGGIYNLLLHFCSMLGFSGTASGAGGQLKEGEEFSSPWPLWIAWPEVPSKH